MHIQCNTASLLEGAEDFETYFHFISPKQYLFHWPEASSNNVYVYNLPHCADYITSDTLQCLDVPIVDSVECENSYPGMISPRMVCAGFMDGGKQHKQCKQQQLFFSFFGGVHTHTKCYLYYVMSVCVCVCVHVSPGCAAGSDCRESVCRSSSSIWTMCTYAVRYWRTRRIIRSSSYRRLALRKEPRLPRFFWPIIAMSSTVELPVWLRDLIRHRDTRWLETRRERERGGEPVRQIERQVGKKKNEIEVERGRQEVGHSQEGPLQQSES